MDVIGTDQLAHTLLIEIVGPAKESPDDFARSLAILSEIVVASEIYGRAKAGGKLVSFPTESGLTVLFLDDPNSPMKCALELWETFRELPSMSVAMGLNSGPVAVAAAPSGDPIAVGEGIELARRLVESAQSGQIRLSAAYAESLGAGDQWSKLHDSESEPVRAEPQKLFILDPGAGTDDAGAEQVRSLLATALSLDGHEMTGDRSTGAGVEWAKSVEERIRSADAVVAIVPGSGAGETMEFELEIALDERRKRGRPQILPVWLKEGPSPESPLAALNQNLHHAIWLGAKDDARVVSEVREALAVGQAETEPQRLDSAGGAVPADSRFYVERPADREFEQALRGHESIVLVKGARQVGKTSLIGRGIRLVNSLGWRWATTDFQRLGSRQIESEIDFYRVLAAALSLELDLPFDFAREWIPELGAGMNMGRFLRSLVSASERPIVWFIDEADRLFAASFASDFFGLVRSWHNARATDPMAPWSRLTIVIGYATEARLFIEDLNQSPFNVGFSVPLTRFTLENTADLNGRYGHPIKSPADIQALYNLVGGQPFLTRRALDVLARGRMDIATLIETADREDGPFADHLKRVLLSVSQLPFVWEALAHSMTNPNLPDSKGLQRLVAAGVLEYKPPNGFVLPCELYRRYLRRYLGGGA